jgi:hypothetical protein
MAVGILLLSPTGASGQPAPVIIGTASYRGRVDDTTMTGTVRTDDGTAEWSATRVR